MRTEGFGGEVKKRILAGTHALSAEYVPSISTIRMLLTPDLYHRASLSPISAMPSHRNRMHSQLSLLRWYGEQGGSIRLVAKATQSQKLNRILKKMDANIPASSTTPTSKPSIFGTSSGLTSPAYSVYPTHSTPTPSHRPGELTSYSTLLPPARRQSWMQASAETKRANMLRIC